MPLCPYCHETIPAHALVCPYCQETLPGDTGGSQSAPLFVTTGNEIPGHHITAFLGIVRGLVVRAPTMGQSFSAGLQQFFGGDIKAYETTCDQAREKAYRRMLGHAQELGADAIIGMRYDATSFADNITEVLAYGTAVKLRVA
jgi:uncharacterized protein YbjQ (UPF0145 family)